MLVACAAALAVIGVTHEAKPTVRQPSPVPTSITGTGESA